MRGCCVQGVFFFGVVFRAGAGSVCLGGVWPGLFLILDGALLELACFLKKPVSGLM